MAIDGFPNPKFPRSVAQALLEQSCHNEATGSMSNPTELESAIFAAARDLPAERRGSYLIKACGADTQLRLRLENRLADQTSSDGEIVVTAFDPDATITSTGVLPREEMIGQTIGRYKLAQKLGEGGFGTVYVADQEEPVKRRVALKITKLGMDTKEVVARFKVEQQAMAMMDHPGIAKVLDAGASPSGRPYFVMELVNGVKITEYCDQHKLHTFARLELFVQVCRAIEHAHQKGIIHRDIKPSNILVASHDGNPVPKVIDFGIAKATQGLGGDKAPVTLIDQFIGTPAYMSPEQAEMGGIDVDTRTDIYSLGVLLYELLTSQTPLETKNLLSRGFDEMRRMIREFEPQIPSLRLGKQQKSESTSTAKRHGTDAHKLIHLVRGDLDWVVMKCLEKDRRLRYETAGNLAADVQRVLDSEPVEARPPNALYRFRKLVRRNKAAFTAIFAIWAALVVGMGVTTWFVIDEKQQRDLAEIQSKRAESARQIAEAARGQADAALKHAEEERQKAEASRLKAVAALEQSEADRAKAQASEKKAEESEKKAEESAREAQASEKKAVESEKEAQAARQQAENALAEARAEHNKADTAEKEVKSTQTLAQSALHEAEVAQGRANAAAVKSEEATKAAATQENLRKQAEASAATAMAQASQWHGALTNLLAGLDAMPPSEALKVVNTSFTAEDFKQPWSAPFLKARGNWRARTGDTNAIADFSQALNLEPGHVELFCRLAPLLAETGTADVYGHACAEFLKQGSNNLGVIKDCLLAPAPEVDTASLATLASNAVAASAAEAHQSNGKIILSLAQYRQGHFAEAADWAEKALTNSTEMGDTSGYSGVAQADAILAMAQQQLNQADAARETLKKGQQILDTKMPKTESGDLGVDWPDWVTARVLLREATGLILPPTPK
jgi:serine/threonine protein kinase